MDEENNGHNPSVENISLGLEPGCCTEHATFKLKANEIDLQCTTL
jgi:hypothetical protein